MRGGSSEGVSPPATGPLVLAASMTIASYVLAPVLARFRAQCPGASIRLRVGNTRDIVAEVGRGELALGLVEAAACGPGVRLVPFIDDELVPVAAPGGRFAASSAADLSRAPILWREPGSNSRQVLERAL